MPGKHHLRGFKIAKKIGSPLRGSDIKIATTKNRLAATRLGHRNSKKIGSPLRGSWTMLRIVVGSNAPPWKKARSAPGMRASELRKFWHFYILKQLFLSIFFRYIRYIVGTKWHACRLTCTDKIIISKCTDKSPKRHYWGGGGGQLPPCPPPPPLATLMVEHLHTTAGSFLT